MSSLYTFYNYESLLQYVKQLIGTPVKTTDPELGEYLKWQKIDNWIKENVRFIYDADYERTMYEVEVDGEPVLPGGVYEVSSSRTTANSSVSYADPITGDPVHVDIAGESIGGGGAKQLPTISEVVTDTTSGTANPSDPAAGIKNAGAGVKVPVGNIITALLAAYGLYSAGITISNWHTWEDVFNTIFPGAIPQDATIDDVKAFATYKWQLYIGSVIDSNEIQAFVPESIVSRLYDYLSAHMEEDGTYEGLQLDLSYMEIHQPNWARFSDYARLYVTVPSSTPGYYDLYLPHLYFHENLLKNWVLDACAQYIGLGFSVSNSTTDVVMAGCDAVVEYIRDNVAPEVLVYKTVWCDVTLYREAHTPKSQPVSPSEISLELTFIDDYDMEIDADLGVHLHYEGPGTAQEPIYSRFLKYGYPGEDTYDYAYELASDHTYSNTPLNSLLINMYYDNNELTIVDGGITPMTVAAKMAYRINGYSSENVYDTNQYPPADPPYDIWFPMRYTNLGYQGELKNYKPDSTISGIVGKDDQPGKTKLRPAASSTGMAWDDWYKTWSQKSKKRGSVDKNGNNTIKTDVPVTMPFSSEKNKQIIDHGYNNPNDTDSYQDPSSQAQRQSGDIPHDTPIEDINEAIEDEVRSYNDSRTIPDSLPDPVPATEPLPQYPENPPVEPEGDSGDTTDPTVMTGVTASGLCSVYNPTKQELINFSGWLWSNNFLDNFLKIFQNPMDAIIGLHILYATPSTTTPSNIICGYLDSGVSAKVVDQQFTEINCGTITIPEYYGTAIDYEPYTQIHCYLPFVGIVSLKPNDVIGKQLNIKYGIDALTGTCLAILTTIKGNSKIACYNFAGNCATQIPISGGSYAQVITSLAGLVASGVGAVATANPLVGLAGAAASVMNSHLDVGHSGAIGANAGAMGIRKPYVIITRKSACEASNYDQFYGYPANKTVTLGSCRGYTRVKSVHIESIPIATSDEKQEIETLLKQGVIIR